MTVSNAPCADAVATYSVNVKASPTASAGGSQSICQTGAATVSGATATNGTIIWTENGAGSITAGATTLTPVYTAAAGDAGNTVTLTMTVSNAPCTNATATYSVIVSTSPTASAGGSQTICQNGTATVSGASSANGTILWTENGSGSITAGATTLTPVYTAAAGDAGNTVTLTMSVSNAPCADATAIYSVVVQGSPTASAGGSQTICQNGTATVSGAASSNGTILWTENGAGTITAGATTLTPVYTAAAGDAGNTVTLTMTVSNSTCSDATATYSIIVKATPTASAGGSQAICQGGTATVSGASSTNGTILWTENGAGSITSGATTLTPVYTSAAGDGGNTVTLTMTVSNSPCAAATATYSVAVSAAVTVANAGPDQTNSATCGLTTVTLAANAPGTGTGNWSIISGAGGSFADATDRTTTFSGTLGVTYVLRWTITNAPCVSTDDVTITFNINPTTANAGADQPICASATTLAGNTPITGTGLWTRISGSGSITTPSSPTTGIAGLTPGTSVYRWTTTNGVCSSFDEMNIVVGAGVQAIDAGPDQLLCNVTIGTLAANTPVAPGVGAWTVIAGGGTLDAPATPNSTVSSLAVGANTFRWTITDGGCVASDDITITVSAPPTASAGGSQTICQNGTATVSGAAFTNGTILWTENGAGSITAGSTTLTPTYTAAAGDAGNTVTLTMTVSNAPCAAATAIYSVDVTTSPTASAGGTQTICQNGTATVSGAAAANGTILWTENGAGSITAGPTTLTPTYTAAAGDAGNTVTLTMTVSNAPCANATATYSVIVKSIPTASAGGSQTICQNGTATVSGASSTNGTILWTENGAGSITAGATTLTPVYTAAAGDAGNTVTLTMTVSNAPCADATATYSVLVNGTPTASAGGSQTICQNGTATVSGSSSTNGTIAWTENGAGSITAGATTLTPVYTAAAGDAGNIVTLTMTVSNSTCPSATATYSVDVKATPTAFSGGSQTICQNGTATVSGAASSNGTILWTEDGTGSITSGATTLTPVYTAAAGDAGNTVTLTMTVSNAPCAAATATYSVDVSATPTASAGGSQTICQNGTATVSGAASSNGTILWTENGAGTITAGATTLTPVYTAAAGDGGTTVTLTMTVSNSPCADATAIYSVVVKATPTASAGGSQTICHTSAATVSGATATNGTMLWTHNGAGSITSGATTLTPVYTAAAGDAGNTVALTMTVSNAPCANATATYSVIVNTSPTASAGGNQTICENATATVSGATSSNGTILWTENGAGTITAGATTLTPVYTAAAGDGGTTVTLTMTVSNSPCADATAIYSVIVKATPTASAGGTQTICHTGAATVSGATATNGTILWTEDGVGSITAGGTTLTPVYTAAAGDAGNTVTLTMTVSNAPCANATATYSVIVNTSPTASAGGSQTICENGTATVSGASSTNGTILWTENGAGSITAGATTLTPVYTAAAGDGGNIVTLTMTVLNSPCANATATYSVDVKATPTASAGGTQTICQNGTATVSGATATNGTILWTENGAGSITAGATTLTPVYTAAVGDAGNTVTLTMTVSNAPCADAVSTYSVIVNAIPTASAGGSQTICQNGTATVSGASSTNGTILWTENGAGTITAGATTLTPVYTAAAGDGGNIVTLTMTVSNSPCSAATATYSVDVKATPTASAGGTSSICQTGSATVSGATATNGTILWTHNGAGSITGVATTLTPTYTAAAGDAGNTITLTMTVSNAPCAAAVATYSVIVSTTPTASAGGSQTICQNGTATVSGAASSNGTILWTHDGTGSITAGATTLTPVYTAAAGDAGNTVTLTMTVSNSPCVAAVATYSVIVKGTPTASAGGTQTICQNGTATVSGAGATNGAILWTENGAGSITAGATTLTPVYTAAAGDAGNTVTLSMTVSNAPCADAVATYSVTVFSLPTASAGGSQTICQNGTATMSGASSTNGTILWTHNGAGSIAGATTLTPVYTASVADGGNTVTLTMTISNNPCTAATATYSVIVMGSPAASAGGTQTICQNGTATVSGATATNGTILWTENGAGSITAGATTLTPVYTAAAGDAGNTVTLTMTVSNSPCSNATATYSVVVMEIPTVAIGGPDQTGAATCGLTSVTLAANTPTIGTGNWSIASGIGGSFANATNPATTFSGTAGSTYTLTWTISNTPCAASTDDVIITFNQNPTVSNAGPDQPSAANCGLTSTPLAANTPVVGTGLWTIISGAGGSFALATNPTTTFSGAVGATYVLRWTISNAPCTPSTDDVSITFGQIPVAPIAGSNSSICSGQTLSLTATTAGSPTYAWTGPASYTASVQNPTIVGATPANSGTYTVIATENGCSSPAATTVVLVMPTPTVTASSNGPVCQGNTISLSATTVAGAIYAWTGPNTFSSASQNPTIGSATTVNSGTYTVVATSGAGCVGANTLHTLSVTPTISVSAGADQTVCANNSNVTLNGIITGGTSTGGWTTTGGGTFLASTADLTGMYLPTSGDTAAGTIIITLTSTNNGGCSAVNDAFTLTITDAPTANAGADQTVCANNAVVTLNGSVNSAATGGTWTTAGTGSFTPTASALNGTYTPSAADTAAGVVTFTLTTTGVGLCSPVADQMTVTITNAPRVNAGATISVCSNNPNAALSGTSTTGSGIWTTSATGTFSPTATALTATFVPSAADILSGSVNLILTSTNNATCNFEDDTVTVVFTSPPVVSAGADQTICANNNTTSITGTSSTGFCQWTSPGLGTFASSTSLSTMYTTSVADNTAGNAVLTITSTNNGGCLAVSDQMTITITPAPTANAGVNQTVCANNPVVTLNGSFTIATGGTWSSNNGTGGFSSLTNMGATYTPSAADTAAGSVNIILTTTGNGLCTAVTSTMVITITDAPRVNAGATISVCINNPNAALNGSSSTGSGTWATLGTGSFTPTTSTLNATYNASAADVLAGNVILVLTSANNGTCNFEDDSVTVFFTPPPTVNAGSDATVCANNASVALSGTSSTGAGTWTTAGTGSFTPTASSLTATYIPSSADTAAGNITLTFTTANNGGCLPVADQMTITITNAPTANAGSDQTVCANNAVIALSGSFSTATGAVWSTIGTGTFVPNTTTMSASYFPSPADTLAGVVTLTLTTTGNGICNVVTDVMVITITDKPHVSAGINSVACKNNPNFPLNGSSSTGSGMWTTLGTGTFAPTAIALNATYVPSTADTTAGTVTLILTTTNVGNCSIEDDSITITYIARPIVNAGANKTVCSNNPLVAVSGTSNTGSGQWTTIGTGTFVSSSSLATNYTPSAADVLASSVRLVLASTNNGTCLPVTDTMIVFFSTSPTANAGANQTVCANNAVVTLNGAFTVSSGAGWTRLGSGTFAPDTMTMNATYTPSAADTATGTVTIILTTTGNGTCLSVSDTMLVTIIDIPKVNAGANQLVCLSNPVAALSGTSTTGSGAWSTIGTGTFTSTSALTTTYIASNADTTAGSVRLVLSSTANGSCNAVTDTILLTFVPTPIVNAGADVTVCANADTVFLVGTSTTGAGIWTTSGTGTFSPTTTSLVPVYFPSNADTASGLITITFTSSGGCAPVFDAMLITITDAPVVNAGIDQIICSATQTIAVSGTVRGGATTGQWSTSGTGTFTPTASSLNATYNITSADSAAGTVTIYLTSTNNGNCRPVIDAAIISIVQPPVVNAGPNQTLCSGPFVTLNGTVIGGSGTGIWSAGTGIFTPNDTTLNAIYRPSASDTAFGAAITVVLTSTNNGTCPPATDTVIIQFIPPPTADAWNDIVACKNKADSLQLSGLVTNAAGGRWSILTGSGSFSPNDSTLNAYYHPDSAALAGDTVVLMLSTIGNGSCPPATDTMYIYFTPSPVVNAGADIPLCYGDTTAPLAGSVTVGATTGEWSTLGTGTFAPHDTLLNATYILSAADTAAGTVTLILTSINNGNCNFVTDTVRITIQTAPIVSAGPDTIICANNGLVNLNGTVISTSGTGLWTTSGTGTFTPTTSTLNATYIPSAADTAGGTIILKLTATNACVPIVDSLVVTITNAPSANAGSDVSICQGTVVALNGSINSVAASAVWTTSGNGTFSPNDSTLNATYVTGTNDTSIVKLILTTRGAGLCLAARDSMFITIGRLPVAAFTVPQICLGQSITFNNTSSVVGVNDSIISWNWNIGNGTDTLKIPTYTYTVAGTDTVMLIVTTTLGCTDTATRVVRINPSPVAMFTTVTSCVLDSVYFTSTSTISSGAIVSYNWNFGDGSSSTSQLPVHYYDSAGVYLVSLTVTSDSGCTSVITNTVVPSKGITAGFDLIADCDFKVIFNDTSNAAAGDSVVFWSWNFGDGSPLNTTSNPTHTYADTGTYIVSLHIITRGGCNDSVIDTLVLLPPPIADFAPQGGTYKAGETVSFTDLSTNAFSWAWSFGDGNTDTIQNPSNTFDLSGVLNVMLIVTNTNGCTDTADYSFIFNTSVVAVPSAFTPNGDGVNDILKVRGGPLKTMDWRIFNEWGNEVFHSTAQDDGWDGTYKGKIQPQARYVFILTGETYGNETINLEGGTTILR